jgi:hypothetical protein
VSTSDLQDWLGTELGRSAFMRALKHFTSAEEYELLLRWASRREPHLSEAEIERAEAIAEVVAELLNRWEPVEVRAESGPSPNRSA